MLSFPQFQSLPRNSPLFQNPGSQTECEVQLIACLPKHIQSPCFNPQHNVKLAMVVHTYNSCIWEAEAEQSGIQTQLHKKFKAVEQVWGQLGMHETVWGKGRLLLSACPSSVRAWLEPQTLKDVGVLCEWHSTRHPSTATGHLGRKRFRAVVKVLWSNQSGTTSQTNGPHTTW